mmetsp:Transcript_16782/g.23346  ORF Transcript_16782/g.23346 Transcript_16782/m.23346 type:complete len:228 (-) Transcript_16782:74-757(-)
MLQPAIDLNNENAKRKSWADIVEEEETERAEKKKQKKKRYRQNKLKGIGEITSCHSSEIFVGGLNDNFKDLEKIKAPVVKKIKWRDERRQQYIKLFESFGSIQQVKQHWTKGYLIIEYSDQKSADRVMDELGDFSGRSNTCKQIEEAIKSTGRTHNIAPKPHFYVRRTHRIFQENIGTDIPNLDKASSKVVMSGDDGLHESCLLPDECDVSSNCDSLEGEDVFHFQS